jgi:site-specific DNA recombinase
MSRIAALYARVSTLRQEQEATVESQIATIEDFARQQGYQLPPDFYFIDQGVSGARLARPALERLRDLATEAAFSAVLCLSPDRLARRYAHQWVLLDEFQALGIHVIFVNQPAVSDDPQGQFFLGMQGVFAEYERAMITERMRRGKLYRLRQGQLMPANPPYGYTYIPISQPNGGRWQVCLVEAEVVQLIYQWYTEQGLSQRAITRRLNHLEDCTSPQGKQWYPSMVRRILTQPAYTGRAYYNRTRTSYEAVGHPRQAGRGYLRGRKYVLRPEDEWIEIQVPALVSEDVWQRAQEHLKMNRKLAQRNNKRHFYLLRSLLVCDICGHTLSGRTSGERVSYFCPYGGKNRPPDIPAHSRSITGSLIEGLVWEAVSNLLRNPTLLADAWQNQAASQDQPPDESARLQARLRSLQRQWARVLDAYQDGLLEKEQLAQRKSLLDRERQALEQRLQQLERQVRQALARDQIVQDFASFCQQIEASLTNPTPELQQEVIRLLIDHVVVGKDEIVIKHIIPTTEDCRLRPGHRDALTARQRSGVARASFGGAQYGGDRCGNAGMGMPLLQSFRNRRNLVCLI